MTTVSSALVSRPTLWSHQKHLAEVGTDRIVAIAQTGNVAASVRWTTVGGAWTDYAADIPGWRQGSLVTYEDAAGTWHAVTVWVQSGTDGGRLDGLLYVMAGAFSADLSTLTWGAATGIEDPAAIGGPIAAPDLVAVPSGSGGAAMVVWSVVHEVNGVMARALQVNVSSSGSITPGTVSTIGGPWPAGGGDSFPSIAVDPVSKHAGVAYGTGSNSGASSSGLKFRKGTFTGGTWSWQPERLIVTTLAPFGNSSEAFPVTCRWDPFSQAWVFGGLLTYTTGDHWFVVWQRDLGDSTTTQLFSDTTPDQYMPSGSLAVDPVTGNVYLFGARHSDIPGSPWPLRMFLLNRSGAGSALTAGGFTVLDSSTDISMVNSHAVEGAIHLLFGQGTATPWTVAYLNVSLNRPPNAPTLLSPVGGITVDIDQTQRLRWAFSDPDTGDVQRARLVQYRVVGDTTWTTAADWSPPSASQFVDVPGGTFTADDYEWQVTVRDALNTVSPVSAMGFFTGIGAPADLTITAPANDGTVAARFDVVWTVTDQDSVQVRVVADDGAGGADTGTVYFDTGEILEASRRTQTVTLDTTVLTTGTVVHPEVRAKASGVWSAWADVRDIASFAIPGLVTVALEWLDVDLNATATQASAVGLLVRVTNEAGEPDPLLPPVSTDLDLHVDAGGSGGVL